MVINLHTIQEAILKTGRSYAVLLSRPSKDGFARLDGHLWKNARLTPVFLWFCPSSCDLVHVQSVIELLSKVNHIATRLSSNDMLNKKFPQMNFHPNIVMIYALLSLKCRESNLRAFLILKLEFCPSFRPSNARIFAKKSARLSPVFYQKWARLKN